MQYPVTDCADFIGAFDHTKFRILQDLQHQLSRRLMIRNCLGNFGLFVTCAVLVPEEGVEPSKDPDP